MAGKQKPVTNAEGTHTWLRNPETGGVWACPNDVVKTFVDRRGWEYTEAPDTSLDGLFDDSTAEGPAQTGFDPAEHTVDEVNAHLAEHAEHAPGEVARVLGLERAGQNRKTIVDPLAGDEEPDPTPAG